MFLTSRWSFALRALIAVLAVALCAGGLSVPAQAVAQAASMYSAEEPSAWSVGLTIDKTVFATGEQVTLTATTNQALAWPYYIHIYDQTTGSRLSSCQPGEGINTCTVSTRFDNGGPHTYYATVAAYYGDDIQATSNTVSAERAAWSLTLDIDRTVFATGEQFTLTATANQNLAWPYYIHIYDQTTGSRLTSCQVGGSTNTCTASTRFDSGGPHTYIATVAAYYGDDIQAVSNEVSSARAAWSVGLTSDKTVFATGEQVTLTATANQNLAWPYYIHIYDQTTGSRLTSCQAGGSINTCTVSTRFDSDGPHTYIAQVAAYYGDDVQATSNTVAAKRERWYLSLARSGATVTATANQNLAWPWYIHIYDQTTGSRLTWCQAGGSTNTCTATVSESGGDFYATVARYYGDDVQADSLGFSADTGRIGFDPASSSGGGNPSANNPQCHCADPVNTVTGEFWLNETDIVVPGRFPLTWSRSYSSSRTADGLLGRGWTSMLDMRVDDSAAAADGVVRVLQENGSSAVYVVGPDGQPLPSESNLTATLAKTETGGWVFTRRDGTEFRFGPAGRLTRIADRHGEGVDLVRADAANPERVTSIVGGAGTLTLTYQSSGRVDAVKGPGNLSVRYAYDAQGRMLSATDQAGKGWKYTYTSGHQLETLTGPNLSPTSTTTNVYDASGRVVVQKDPVGGETRFAYDSAAGAAGTTSTTVTDQAGRATRYVYDNGWLAQKVQDPEGSAPRTWTYQNGPTGQPVAVTDPLGRTTFISYNSRGDRLSVTSPTGAVTKWTYNAFGDVKTVTSPKGVTATNVYDTLGRLESSTVPLNADQEATRSYTYGDPAHPGDITAITDERGNTTALTYDTAGRLIKTVSPGGATETRTYTPEGLLKSVTDPRGNAAGADPAWFTTTYTYWSSGRLWTVSRPHLGTALTLTYDKAGNVTKRENAEFKAESFTYDKAHRLTSYTNRLGKTTTYDYDPTGLIASVTDPTGARTTYTYNAYGEVASVTRPQGNAPSATEPVRDAYTTTFGYDAAGRTTSVRVPNPNGGDPIVTRTAYDPDGRIASVTNPVGAVTEYGYDANGNLTSLVDADGNETTFTYDKANRQVSTTDAKGHTTTYGYDLASNRTSETTHMGRTTTWSYTPDGRVASTVTPRGNEQGANPDTYRTRYTYDLDGNLTAVTDPRGAVTAYTYDQAGRNTFITTPLGRKTENTYDTLSRLTRTVRYGAGALTYTYDAEGNVVTKANPLGGTLTYAYDAAGRIATVTDPKNKVTTYQYTPSGDLASVEGPRGTTTYDYDPLGRLLNVDYSDTTPDVAYEYDPASRRTTMTDGTGTTTYAYDTLDRLTGVTTAATAFTYGYDKVGNLTTVNGPAGTLATTYNGDNLPVTMTRGTSTPTTYTYDADGLLASLNLPNGTAKQYTRDPLGQVTKLTHQTPTGTLATRDYTYDLAGNPTRLDITRNGTTTTRQWLYDNADRVTHECVTAAPCTGTNTVPTRYEYDPAGNRTRHVANGVTTTFTYDNTGRMVTSQQGTGPVNNAYTYDADGNLTADGTRTYTYDLAGRTTSVTSPAAAPSTGTVTTEYEYDGNGNRATATTGGRTTRYAWDANNPLPMLASETTDTTDTTQHTYTYNPDGTPNSMRADDGTSTPADWYYLTDHLGSVTEVTDTTGERALSYDYTPYGEQRGPPAPDAAGAPAHQPYRYTGEYLDPTTGLYNLRARQYDPALGRFTATDPLGGTLDAVPGTSLYAYANNNPLLYTDPSGLWGWADIKREVGYQFAGAQVTAEAAKARLALEWQYQTAPGISGYRDSFTSITASQVSDVWSGYVDGLYQFGTFASPAKMLGLLPGSAGWGDPCSAESLGGGYAATLATFFVPFGGAAKGAEATARSADDALRAFVQGMSDDYAQAAYAGGTRVSGRKPRVAAIAFDPVRGAVYPGLNGQVTHAGLRMPWRLRARLPIRSLNNHNKNSARNCAEAAACSRAIADGARLDDLIVSASWVGKKSKPASYCPNCESWVPNQRGR
ncbi:DUF6531 domain-containing protein [Nocardioides sp. GCM10027113]|uniref:DUF6531 domain-containing protein n=1 Tax=unclassified Nocardioides TaxID=2615069 RepID=UPI0036154FD5